MKLTFSKPYQSITSFPELELNDFAIITGINGSGKTHLLNAINLGNIKIDGIDPSEIVFYNYNDFTIYNGDPGNDAQIQQRYSNFTNKSNLFSQKLNADRSQALSSFHLNYDFGLFQMNEYLFHHFPNFFELTDWNDADYELYDQHLANIDPNNPHPFFQLLNPHQKAFFERIGYFPIQDIRTFIKSVRDFNKKIQAMQILRSSGYNRALTAWKDEELAEFIEQNNAIENKRMNFETMSMEGRLGLSLSLTNFLQFGLMIPEFFENLTLDSSLVIKGHMETIFLEIEKHLDSTLPPKTLNFIKAINEGDILRPIASDSGFLNLHDIKIAEKQYQIQKKQNEIEEFKHYKKKPSNFLSEEEFTSLNGLSPVETLNKVLNDYDCNGYEFKQSELQLDFANGVNTQDVHISLYNKTGNYQTNLEALSSGERTLLALAFTIHKLKQRRVIARLFLMDEIDSALHPSMSKRLLKVLHELFHKQLGLSIIISTHSPSTVAFAPKDSTYVMRRDQNPKLIFASKDAALSELTIGVPSFSINYENRRQIFVESKYDAEYYEALYILLKDHLDNEVSLNFISSGDAETNKNGMGIANCDQVIKITKLLRTSGNKFIFGIIDWDLKNSNQHDGVKVLGLNQRYSIESYLLDPLLVGMLLWRENYVDATFFGLASGIKYYEVINFEATQLQRIVDAIIEKLNLIINPNDSTINKYQTIEGIELSLPKWFLEHQGHQLEEYYIKAFPKLNEVKKGKEWLLKETIITKVIADFSKLAPVDLVTILKQVQEV